jgi:four helix bundle protein
MKADDIKRRTKEFALQIIRLIDKLPKNRTSNVIGVQLLRAATSIGANYRSACRARSRADFVSKICIVEEEADESAYWLELLIEAKIIHYNEINNLLQEARELTAIFSASGKTAKQK